MQHFKVPTETSVFGCSLLDHADALHAARLAIDELKQSHPESTPSNVKAVYMSPWKSHQLNHNLQPLIQVVAEKIKFTVEHYLGVSLDLSLIHI